MGDHQGVFAPVSNASDICAARIVRTNSEGFRSDVYDDATAKSIECEGQPTCGYGTRCRGWSKRFAQAVLSFDLVEREVELIQFTWYIGLNDARRSALLEIDMNQGEAGLIKGYPMLIEAVQADNWERAAAECNVKEDSLKARYARIAKILLTGVDQ